VESIAVIGAGSVGAAVGRALAAIGHAVTFGVRDASDPRHAGLGDVVVGVQEAARGATVVLLALPADAVADVVPRLGLRAGQVVIDATNAVGAPVPGGFSTMGELVASLVPEGVHLVKAFNTVGAEHLGDGRTAHGGVFLPIAGDPDALDAAATLATALGFDVAALGGRDHIAMVEEHARLWIHLAFGCGWGRQFAFTVARS
jgi:predicted dinucleotide-binding enzyme